MRNVNTGSKARLNRCAEKYKNDGTEQNGKEHIRTEQKRTK